MTRGAAAGASGTVRSPLRGRRVGDGVGEVGRFVVVVVVVPPHVRLGLRVVLRRVLPLLLAPERGDVEVAPGGAEPFVAALVDEGGAEGVVALGEGGVADGHV